MRIALLSDTHFGDPMCSLAAPTEAGQYVLGPAYPQFRAAVGSDLDYLVLVGDIFDFSVANYGEAYRAAKPFFQQIATDGTLKRRGGIPAAQLIYLPGNHDFDVWHQVEYEVNVMRRMHARKLPRSFRWSVPGVMDLRRNVRRPTFTLPHVMRDDGSTEYGGLFLDDLTCTDDAESSDEHRFPFCVAFPNLYLLTDDFSALVTHGHYLEPYWSLVGEIAPLIAGHDLGVSDPLTVRQLVALNLPLNQLACSGLGQAGPLTSIVREVQREVKNGYFERVERYVARLDQRVLDDLADYGWADPREWISDFIIRFASSKLLDFIKLGKTTRYDAEFLTTARQRRGFGKYMLACQAELATLCSDFSLADEAEVQPLSRLMYGHTHLPVAWGARGCTLESDAGQISCTNFGGWLHREPSEAGANLEGAEVVIIENG
ncbi:MAG TPA: metallophosphoesterase, partial [Polyangiaceae bacterium]|nr:metallophosphoesterase [Polyangiaceae bacterium]